MIDFERAESVCVQPINFTWCFCLFYGYSIKKNLANIIFITPQTEWPFTIFASKASTFLRKLKSLQLLQWICGSRCKREKNVIFIPFFDRFHNTSIVNIAKVEKPCYDSIFISLFNLCKFHFHYFHKQYTFEDFLTCSYIICHQLFSTCLNNVPQHYIAISSILSDSTNIHSQQNSFRNQINAYYLYHFHLELVSVWEEKRVSDLLFIIEHVLW